MNMQHIQYDSLIFRNPLIILVQSIKNLLFYPVLSAINTNYKTKVNKFYIKFTL